MTIKNKPSQGNKRLTLDRTVVRNVSSRVRIPCGVKTGMRAAIPIEIDADTFDADTFISPRADTFVH